MIGWSPTTTALVAAGVVVGTALLVGAVAGLLKRDRAAGGAIYRSMARRLGLSRRQRRLLHSIAVEAGLPTPASLLLSRGCFEHARRRARGRARDEARLAAIAARVFGERPADSSAMTT